MARVSRRNVSNRGRSGMERVVASPGFNPRAKVQVRTAPPVPAGPSCSGRRTGPQRRHPLVLPVVVVTPWARPPGEGVGPLATRLRRLPVDRHLVAPFGASPSANSSTRPGRSSPPGGCRRGATRSSGRRWRRRTGCSGRSGRPRSRRWGGSLARVAPCGRGPVRSTVCVSLGRFAVQFAFDVAWWAAFFGRQSILAGPVVVDPLQSGRRPAVLRRERETDANRFRPDRLPQFQGSRRRSTGDSP